MILDAKTDKLNGKIQFVCELILSMKKGDKLGKGSTWEKEAKSLAKNVLKLIERLELPKWGFPEYDR